MAEAYIGLGANLDQPRQQLCVAIERLRQQPAVLALRCSSFYRSAPWGDADQPPFVNAVAVVETTLTPLALLEVCQQIEQALGRVRDPERPWGPRRVDLDLLLYDKAVMATERLTLPHPWMTRRAFVLQPLLELWPGARLPDGTVLADALAALPERCTPLPDGAA